MTPSTKLLVLIPSFFDLDVAQKVAEEVKIALESKSLVDVFIIDETLGADSGWESGSESYRVSNDYRMGAQSAIVSMLKKNKQLLSKYDFVCTLDGDGEDNPSDIKRLLGSALDGNEIVLARRKKRHATLAFKVSRSFFQLIFALLTGHLLTTGSFAIVQTDWLYRNLERPEFTLSYSGALIALPARRVLLPCERAPRRKGKSRMKLSDSISDGLRLLLPFAPRIAARSFLFFLLSTAIAVVTGVWILIANLTGIAAPGWSTSALVLVGVIITASAVISLVTMGIMALLLLSNPGLMSRPESVAEAS